MIPTHDRVAWRQRSPAVRASQEVGPPGCGESGGEDNTTQGNLDGGAAGGAACAVKIFVLDVLQLVQVQVPSPWMQRKERDLT